MSLMRLLLPYTYVWRSTRSGLSLLCSCYFYLSWDLDAFNFWLPVKNRCRNRCRKWSVSQESFTYSHQNLLGDVEWLSFIACIVLSVCRVLFVYRRWVLQLADVRWLSRLSWLSFVHSSDTVHRYSLYHPYLWKSTSRESKHGRSTCRRRRLVFWLAEYLHFGPVFSILWCS
jgi:hypothetical protein